MKELTPAQIEYRRRENVRIQNEIKLKAAKAIGRKRWQQKYDAARYDEFKVLQNRNYYRIKAGIPVELPKLKAIPGKFNL